MDERLYRTLVRVAVILTVAWVGWSVYDSFLRDRAPGELAYHAGNRHFEDGRWEAALRAYDEALAANPDFIHALRGRARSLMQLGRHEEALAAFDEAIRREPGFAATWANRGILHDRMGHYEAAIADYERALALDPSLNDGPNWLTRFLRLQPRRPPGIGDRARYLRAQLALPPAERVLRVPELDAAQRPYKK